MATPWIDPTLAVLLVVGAGGPLVGLFGLFAPRRRSGLWVVVPAVFGLMAVSVSAVAAVLGQSPAIWAPPLGMVGVCVGFWVLRSGGVRQAGGIVARVLCSPRTSSVCLLAGGPVLAGWWAAASLAPDPCELPLEHPLHALADGPRNLAEVKPSPAQTDRGRSVTVSSRVPRKHIDADFLAKQSEVIRRWGFHEQIITVRDCDQDCNCHGWVFTGGRYWIAGGQVAGILEDNGYEEVMEPRPGDLVVYRDDKGDITHTGLVRCAGGDGPLLIESKWGGLGRFLHPPEVHCYAPDEPRYYRSPRQGHILRGFPGAPTSPPPVLALEEWATDPADPPALLETTPCEF
jgi:hypothetical protein